MKTNWLKVTIVGLTLALGTSSSALADWGSWGGFGSGGGSGGGGSWGDYGGSVGGGSWGGYGSGGSTGMGPLRRLISRIHDHRAHRVAMRGYGSHGSWGGGGSHGSWGGGSTGWGGGSHGSWGGGSHGSWGGVSYGSGGGWSSTGGHGSGGYGSGGSTGFYSAPAVVESVAASGCACGTTTSYGVEVIGTPVEHGAPAPPVETIEPQPAAEAGDQAGVLKLNVPASAKVFINGNPTKSEGSTRSFVSKGLSPGMRYRYQVRAEMTRDGKVVEQTKYVSLRAGKTAALAFDFGDNKAVETSLTLNVPADAKVTLSGNETKAEGPVRRFRTQKIAEGMKWSDYRIEVVVEREGKKLTKHQDVTISGGDQLELTFDFNEVKLADAR